MLDIKFIRENLEKIKEAARKKRIDIDISQLFNLDEKRRNFLQNIETLRAEQNKASSIISSLTGTKKQKEVAKMKKISNELKKLEKDFLPIDEEYRYLMLLIPQIPAPQVPEGKDDNDNQELYKVGTPPKFQFKTKDHVEIGRSLDILDVERAVRIAGSRTYFLKGDGARLEMAVLMYTLNKLVSKGFTPFICPVMVNFKAMMGTGYFPGGEDQAYSLEKDKLFLIGTSEVPVTSYHMGEILDENDLPKYYCGFSPCFRREAGTYGKDTHGVYRIHQFQKVEQVIVCKADEHESSKMHDFILNNAEEVLKDLKLPYRVVAVCSGEMGQGQVYKNDIETWMHSRKSYGETHSCSTFHDFQARRLNMRYRDKNGNIKFCHTLNNTCIASPRILIAILENYQNKDGSVTIPQALRPYMGGQEKIIRKN